MSVSLTSRELQVSACKTAKSGFVNKEKLNLSDSTISAFRLVELELFGHDGELLLSPLSGHI